MWERAPRLMPDVISRHDLLLDGAISRHGGTVFTAGGDGFGAAFTSAAKAGAAAVAVQHDVGGEPWPGSGSDPRTCGTTQWRCDRARRQLLRRSRESGCPRGGSRSWRSDHPLGRYGGSRRRRGMAARRFGFPQAERIGETRAALPPRRWRPARLALPLRACRRARWKSSHQALALVRSHQRAQRPDGTDLERVVEVTVTGPGGVGKSRLAVEAARAAWESFSDGVWLVELSEIVEPSDVAPAVDSTIRLQTGAGVDRAVITASALAGQRVLILLDNCEHVIDGVVDLVTAIGSACPSATVLATSRHVLGLHDERRLRLEPLTRRRPQREVRFNTTVLRPRRRSRRLPSDRGRASARREGLHEAGRSSAQYRAGRRSASHDEPVGAP